MTRDGRAAGGSKGRLPAEWTSFVDRRMEVAEVKRARNKPIDQMDVRDLSFRAIQDWWEARTTDGKRANIVRPTYICGPGDFSDRFTYWPFRVAQGGEMLAPGTPDDPIQFIVMDTLERLQDLDRRLTGHSPPPPSEDPPAQEGPALGPKPRMPAQETVAGPGGDPATDFRSTWLGAPRREKGAPK